MDKLGGSGLKSSIGLQLHDQPRFLPSEALTGAGGPTDSSDCEREASVHHHTDLSMDCFCVLTTWQLVSPERVIREKGKSHTSFSTLILGAIHCRFFHVLLMKSQFAKYRSL